jgi:hypothetical protein
MRPFSVPSSSVVLASSTHSVVKALWSFNTAQKFKSVNGEIGHGGWIKGAGAVMVANGMVYVISSNLESSAVLLAFSKAH